jgi:ADP-ribose pyrophosphatase YjhB (NUDIX family)
MSIDFIPQRLYNQILKNIPIVCVDIVVTYRPSAFKTLALLIKRKDFPCKDQWWLVGGRMRKFESFHMTAKRILKEEVGIKLSNRNYSLKTIALASTIFSESPVKNNPMQSINIVCYCEVPNKKVILNSHSSDYEWFDTNNFTDISGFNPYIIKCIQANTQRVSLIS